MHGYTIKWGKLLELHRFFCRKSRHYVGVGYGRVITGPCTVMYAQKYKLKDLIRFPFAYYRFMKSCANEWLMEPCKDYSDGIGY